MNKLYNIFFSIILSYCLLNLVVTLPSLMILSVVEYVTKVQIDLVAICQNGQVTYYKQVSMDLIRHETQHCK